MTFEAGERVGPYEIVGTLGAGGMGVVYRARDTRLERDVALKTLAPGSLSDPTRCQRFAHEAKTAGALDHPSLLTVHDVGDDAGTPYLVTELLEGETLRERLRGGALPARKVVELGVQAAEALAAVHEKGIVHRDLKPENLFVTREGRLKVLDFGVARVLDAPEGGEASETLTESGAVVGTAGYMAPEQVRGRQADARSDIFALGAILYEMLSGQRAFVGETPIERSHAVLTGEPPREAARRHASAALVRVLDRCLEKAPDERFQHARDLAFALEAVGDGAMASLPVKSARSARGGLTRIVLAALGVVAVAGAGVAIGRVLDRAPAEAASPVASASAASPPADEVLRAVPRRVSFRNGLVEAARFASDGRTLVYSGMFEGAPPQIVAGMLGSAESRIVAGPYATLFAVSRADELAIGTRKPWPENQKGAVLSRMSLSGGAARPVVEDVNCADFAPDGTLLVTRSEKRGGFRIELPPGHVVVESEMWLGCARMSPRGDRIAFERHPVPMDDRGHVEVIDLDGHVVARSEDAWTLQGLAWTPDGEEVWYTAGDHGMQRGIRSLGLDGSGRELYVSTGSSVLYDVDAAGRALVSVGLHRTRIFGRMAGSERERSLGLFDGSFPMDLSDDGEALLFIEGLGAADDEIQTYLRTADGSPPVLIATGWARALSPDKKWALVSPSPPFTTLSLVPTGPGEARHLPDGGFGVIYGARFFRDGQSIAIWARGADKREHVYVQSLAVPVGPGPEAPALDLAPRQLGEEEFELTAPPSRDGKSLAGYAPGRGAAMLDVATGHVELVAGLEKGDLPLQFAADGRSLFLVRPHAQSQEALVKLRRYEFASKKVTDLGEFGPTDTVGVQSVERGIMTPDGKHYAYLVSQRLDDLFVVEGLR